MGAAVDDCFGASMGDLVGVFEGTTVGLSVGDFVGTSVGGSYTTRAIVATYGVAIFAVTLQCLCVPPGFNNCER